jgi:transcription termination factor NusB
MREVYENLPKDAKRSGRITAHQVRCNAFRDGLRSRNGPFPKLQKKINDECREAVKKNCNSMKQRLNKVFAEIEADIDRACPSGDDDSEEAATFRLKLLDLIAEARDKIEKEIRPALEEARLAGTQASGH